MATGTILWISGLGDDFLAGQIGNDTIDYSSRTAKVTATIAIDPETGIATGGGGQAGRRSRTIQVIGKIEPVDRQATIRKSPGPATWYPHKYILLPTKYSAGPGSDTLQGIGPDDDLINIAPITLHGGTGNDTLHYDSSERDHLFGDDGNDTFIADDDDAGFGSIDGGTGTDTEDVNVDVASDQTLGSGIENMNVGGSPSFGPVIIQGNNLNNIITIQVSG